MAKSNVRRGDRGSGADLINQRRAMDEAINESLREETGNDKLDANRLNNQKETSHKPDVSEKRTGHDKNN